MDTYSVTDWTLQWAFYLSDGFALGRMLGAVHEPEFVLPLGYIH